MTSDGWRYAAASVIGSSHIKASSACQDANICTYLEHIDAMVCIVCDGAGSALHAAEGAKLTCNVIRDEINKAHPSVLNEETFATACVFLTQETLTERAIQSAARTKDFACTVLVSIAFADQLTCWQIGDGAICYRQAGRQDFEYAFWPTKGEYANVTEFVTDADAPAKLQFMNVNLEISDLAVFSDGLERLALDFSSQAVHSKFFDGMFPYLYRRPEGYLDDVSKQMNDFLSSERVNQRTDDDKTLVLASRRHENAA